MTAIVCHDAGGAEILSDYVLVNSDQYVYVLEGPALLIFGKKIDGIETVSLPTSVALADELLCGTSWASDLEYNAIAAFSKAGKKTSAFLDHWVNYRERFTRNAEVHLPDEILVGDEYAAQLAETIFPATPVRLFPNPYWASIKKELNHYNTSSRKNPHGILYVCEPVKDHALKQFGDERYWGFTEEDAVLFFFERVALFPEAEQGITIRPHPSEALGKYNWVAEQFGSKYPISISNEISLYQQVADSVTVFGCESMAMVIALFAGKKVVSCLPPGSKNCSLPFKEIKMLRNIQQ